MKKYISNDGHAYHVGTETIIDENKDSYLYIAADATNNANNENDFIIFVEDKFNGSPTFIGFACVDEDEDFSNIEVSVYGFDVQEIYGKVGNQVEEIKEYQKINSNEFGTTELHFDEDEVVLNVKLTQDPYPEYHENNTDTHTYYTAHAKSQTGRDLKVWWCVRTADDDGNPLEEVDEKDFAQAVGWEWLD